MLPKIRFNISLSSFAIAILLFAAFPGFAQNSNRNWSVKWESPGAFIENKGQFPLGRPNTDVLFAVDDGQKMVYFTKHGLTYAFTKKERKEEEEGERRKMSEKEWVKEEAEEKRAEIEKDQVRIEWENPSANVELLAGEVTSDYFTYAVSENGVWKSLENIHSFKTLTYKNLYPNIDVEFVFHPVEGLKYTITVHPGGNPALIKMNYPDGKRLGIQKNGDLHIRTDFGNMIDHAPVSFYSGENGLRIPSAFVKENKTIGFEIGAYDHSRTLIIDPWTITPTFSNCNKIWECERDAAGNVYLYGGDTPMRLRKYNSAGTLLWTYNTPWDTSGFWVGSFVVDQAGNSFVTSGSNGEIAKVNTSGAQVWYNNPNGLFGPLFEYWHLTFNCDETQLVVGGMRAPNPFSIAQYRGAIMNINLTNGAVLGYTPVGWVAGLNIKEAKTICASPNGKYYFMTLDSVGCINSSLALQYKTLSGYAFSYGTASYGVTNQGISAIRATSSFIYTRSGTTVHKRDIATGAIIGTAAIPGGLNTSAFGFNSPGCSGLDLDNCGNVYVGSGNQVVKYDANLNQLSTAATTSAVYDVAVTGSGEVIACGNGFASSLNMTACGVVVMTCSLSPLAATISSTNPVCNAQCTGTATASPSGGTAPYTYSWTNSQTTATATGLCAGSYTCTITDNVGATTTVSVTITQPPVIAASATATATSCGNTNGTATATASGGTGTLTYSWAPSGGNAATASNLASGNYTVTVTDANGCTQTATVNVGSSSVPVASLQAQTNVNCFGGSTGSATVTVTGGTPSYSYAWTPSGGNASSATGLSIGTYTCTVTDGAGCTTTQTVTITQPTVLTASASATPTGCSSGTGTATATAGGGAGSYTYSWAPSGGNAATANNLSAGSYTVTVTDANGCTTTAVANVSSSGGPTVTTQSTADVSCFGGTNGNATVSATGNGPFTYSWAPSGGNAATANNLPAGTYTVSVTDNNNCTSLQTITITEPPVLTSSVSSTPAACNTNTGTASVTAGGGTGSYTYSWAPSGGTGATENNLAAGSYTVTVTDANGCTSTAIANVSSSGGATVTVQSTADVTCFGGVNGNATVSASGNGPFTYSWAPSGGNAASATNLPAGTYTVSVTDNNNCVTLQTIIITEPAQITTNTSAVPATCGNNNGSATVVPSGGTGTFTYSWAPSGGTNASATNLAAGSYTVTVTDANGCTATDTVTITNAGAPSITLQSTADVSCFGASTGSATIVASGGSSPYTYSWSPSGGTNATATNLAAGTYTVTVTGSDGCTQTQTVTITQPAAMALTASSTPEDCGNGNGTASITASGGSPGYTYAWSNGGNTNTISNLSAGSYSVTVTDANGCTQTSTVAIANAGSAVANAGTSVTIQQGQSTNLSGSGGGTYSWSPPGSLSCTNCPNPVASPTVTTTYTLTVTDSLGCTATDTVTIFVDIACGELYLPNAFSPNYDGQNDVLYVRGNCIEFLQFDVYSRWGERVFSTTDPALGWDGIWRGKECEAAVYTYVLRATLLDGTKIEDQGNISLVK